MAEMTGVAETTGVAVGASEVHDAGGTGGPASETS